MVFEVRRELVVAAGTAATLTLPLLDAMTPAFARAASPDKTPRRMVAVNVDLGFMPEEFFPAATGRNYQLSPYLKELAVFRDDFIVFSGVSHPEVDGGHQADICFLIGAFYLCFSGFKNFIFFD